MITQKITGRENIRSMDQPEAETTAVKALAYMAQDAEMIADFQAISGIRPDQIRQAATAPGFLAGVLEFICANESRLHGFCTDSDLAPETVDFARQALVGPPRDWSG